MEINELTLYSTFIIDGVKMETSPARMLDTAAGINSCSGKSSVEDAVIDESIDPSPDTSSLEDDKIGEYLKTVLPASLKKRSVPVETAESFAKARVAKALIDTLWSRDNFTLEDISLHAGWSWNCEPTGNMAALYHSVEAVVDYLDALGVGLEGWSFEEGDKCEVEFLPSEKSTSRCPSVISGKDSGWLVYIPFDTCSFRLGGSVLAETSAQDCGKAPSITDADYFIDCFEVVKELVEDGIVLSGVTVSDGGLMAALGRIAAGTGVKADVSDILNSYKGTSLVNLMFSEVPGVVIEISDDDYDYVDAELLLQDIAYYPFAHPASGEKGLHISTDRTPGITGILQSLMCGQSSEGED